MKRLTSILAISVIAVMSAGAARADIASTTYVDNKVTPVSTKANANAGEIEKLQSGKQDKSAMVGSTSDKLDDVNNDTNYPTVAAVYTITTSALGNQVNNKLDKKFTGATDKNKAVITNDDGAITTGTISSAMITDGTIVNDDIAADALIAQSKIAGLADSIADAKKAGTDANTALETYKTFNNEAVKAVKATADDTAAAVNNEKTGLVATKQIADANAAKLATMATSATVTALTTRVETAENNIKGKQNKLVSGKNGNISGSNGVSVTVGTDGKITVFGNQNAIDTAISNMVSKTSAAATYATKTELGNKQDKLDVTQLAAVNSGATKAKIDAIATNTTAAANAKSAADAAQNTANTAKKTAEAAIAAPAAPAAGTETSNDGLYTLTMKVDGSTRTYAWEKIGR